MAISGLKDITYKDDGSLRLPVAELEALYKLGITISDTETTGLNRTRCGLTEFASIRAVKNDAPEAACPYRLELLHRFILPFRPEYQDYLDAVAQAMTDNEPLPPYNRALYEYEIDARAMAITGTEFMRDRLDGPLVGMKVLGQPVPAVPFYEALPDMQNFTHHGVGDVYYNTPFDKPFLAELIRDIGAHETAVHNEYLGDHDESATDKERELFRDIARHLQREAPDLSVFPYEELENDFERRQLVQLIRDATHAPESYTNSALYQCLYYGFMAARGVNESNRLDDAYRSLVDPEFTMRAEHSAVEDIVMAARVAVRLADHFDGEIPTMAQLFTQLIHRPELDPAATIGVLPPRDQRSDGSKAGLIQGDIRIAFSKPVSAFTPEAQRLWEFLHRFNDVLRLNSRVPQHLLEFDEKAPAVVINAERRQPLSLNFLKKLILFGQILDSPLIDNYFPFDSTGTRIDIRLKSGALIEDCHLGSFRANLKFLEAHPEIAESSLKLIGDIRKFDRRIGIILIRENETHTGYRLIIKGHLRQFGDVAIDLPDGYAPAEVSPLIFAKLDRLIKLGVIPYAQSLELARENEDAAEVDVARDDDAEKSDGSIASSIVSIGAHSNQMTFTIDPVVMQLMCLQMQVPLNELLAHGRIGTRQGDLSLAYHPTPSPYYSLSGEFDAFWDFIYAPDEEMPELRIESVVEKPSNILRNSSWLLFRLQQIPGTYDVTMEGNRVILLQKDGVSLEGLNLLYHSGIPFHAKADRIELDAAELMQDSFHWSVTLSRVQEARERELRREDAAEKKRLSGKESRRSKDAARPELTPPQFLQSVHQALLSTEVHEISIDEFKQCWIMDRASDDDSAPSPRHPVDHQDNRSYRRAEHGIDPRYSPIKGEQRLTVMDDASGNRVVEMSAFTYHLWAAWCHKRRKPCPKPLSQNADNLTLILPARQVGAMMKQIESIASAVYDLQRVGGVARLPADRLAQRAAQEADIYLPEIRLLDDSSLLSDLLAMHTHLSDKQFEDNLKALQHRLPNPRESDYRRDELFILADRVLGLSATIEALDAQLHDTLYKSGAFKFQGQVGSLNYQSRTRHDLATLGLFIESIEEKLNQPDAAETDQLHLLHRDLRVAREKLFRFATANQRLDEAVSVLRGKLTGDESKGASNLRDTMRRCFLFLASNVAIDYAEDASDAELVARMQDYEDYTLRMLSTDAEPSERAEQQFKQDIYKNRAWHILAQLPEAGEDYERMARVVRYLLGKAEPGWSEQQVQSVVQLYASDITARGAIERLQLTLTEAGFPLKSEKSWSAEKLLLQRRMLDDMSLRNESPELTAEQSDQIETRIRKAYNTQAKRYLKLLANPQAANSGTASLEEREFYKERADFCLSQAAVDSKGQPYDETRIAGMIAKAERAPFKLKSYLGAKHVIEDSPPPSKLDDYLKIIDQEGCENAARHMMQQRALRHQQGQQAELNEPLPYQVGGVDVATFRERKALLNSIAHVLHETHDLMMINFHAVRDLAAAISLLQLDSHMASGLYGNNDEQLAHIGDAIRFKPEGSRIDPQVIRSVHHTASMLRTGLLQDYSEQFAQLHIPLTKLSDTHLRCQFKDLVKWVEARCPELAPPERQFTPPPALTRAQQSQALRFSSERMAVIHYPGLSFVAHIPARGQEANLSFTLEPAAPHDRIGQSLRRVMKEISKTGWGHACRFTDGSDGSATFNVPGGMLAPVIALLGITEKLGAIRPIDHIRFSVRDQGLRFDLIRPSGRQAREMLQGKLQLALSGMNAQLSSWGDLIQGSAGEPVTFSIALTHGLGAEPPQTVIASTQDAEKAASAFAASHGANASERAALRERVREAAQQSPRDILRKAGKSEHYSHIAQILDASNRGSGPSR